MEKQKKITIKDIAAKVGVSVATVSRVLSNKPSGMISEKTKNAIIKTAHELNYRPNRLAQALVTGTSKTIALMAYSITSDYYFEIISTLNEIIKNDNYDLKIIESENKVINTSLNELFVDGIILFDTINSLSEDIINYALDNIPTVCLGSRYSDKYNYVIGNLKRGYHDILNHLYEIGKRKILLPNTSNDSIYYEVYNEFMKEKGLEPIIIDQITPKYVFYKLEDAYTNLKNHIEKNGINFDSVYCHNDTIALGVLRCLQDYKVSIPEEVAVTGYDGTKVTEFYNPRLTTIKQPIKEMCEKTWEILKRHIEDNTLPPEHKIFDTELIIRESTLKK